MAEIPFIPPEILLEILEYAGPAGPGDRTGGWLCLSLSSLLTTSVSFSMSIMSFRNFSLTKWSRSCETILDSLTQHDFADAIMLIRNELCANSLCLLPRQRQYLVAILFRIVIKSFEIDSVSLEAVNAGSEACFQRNQHFFETLGLMNPARFCEFIGGFSDCTESNLRLQNANYIKKKQESFGSKCVPIHRQILKNSAACVVDLNLLRPYPDDSMTKSSLPPPQQPLQTLQGLLPLQHGEGTVPKYLPIELELSKTKTLEEVILHDNMRSMTVTSSELCGDRLTDFVSLPCAPFSGTFFSGGIGYNSNEALNTHHVQCFVQRTYQGRKRGYKYEMFLEPSNSRNSRCKLIMTATRNRKIGKRAIVITNGQKRIIGRVKWGKVFFQDSFKFYQIKNEGEVEVGGLRYSKPSIFTKGGFYKKPRVILSDINRIEAEESVTESPHNRGNKRDIVPLIPPHKKTISLMNREPLFNPEVSSFCASGPFA